MRKSLSILMLVCLLCGMVLPAGAEEGGKAAQLYAQTGDDTDYQTSLTFEAGETLSARFYTAAAAESLIDAGTFTSDKTGLTIGEPGTDGNCVLSSETPDTYTVSYEEGGITYRMEVAVTEPAAATNTITVPDAATLSTILSDQAKFDAFLTANHYSKTGDLTLVLPVGDLDSVTCRVQLSNGAKLILKGAADKKTNMKDGIRVSVPNVCLDGIKFGNSVTVDPGCNLTVSNCGFTTSSSKYAFRLIQDADEEVSRLSLTSNIFSGSSTICMASILKASTSTEDTAEIGRWLATTKGGNTTEVIDFGVHIDEEEGEALHITFSSSKASHVNNGWSFNFITNCDFKDAYVVYGNKRTIYKLDSAKKQITIGAHTKGEYTVVNGSYPKLEKKSGYYVVKVSEKHEFYLNEIILDNFPYAAADITLSGKKVDYTMSTVSGKRTVTIPKLSEGTYTIKETTKTVTKTTKTKTTSRKYTTSQDYFLVTPQGFSNAVRYVRDNLVTLNCTEAGTKAISLPVPSMAAAAEKGYSVLVKTKGAELTLDAAALKSLAQQAKGTTVLLHYKSLNHKTLTAVGQASVKSHLAQHPGDSADLAFLVTATSDSETIEDLQKGTITLKIPFIVLPGAEEIDNMVYALQGESVSEARDTTVADGYLTTKLLDLTEHMVFQAGEPVETTVETTEETAVETTEPETGDYTEDLEEEEEEDGFPVWIPAAAVLLLAGGGAVAWFLFFRKRLKK